MNNTQKIQRVTSRGQITLPVSWRRRHGNTGTVIVRTNGDSLEVTPLRTEDELEEEWVALFDAIRDNGGKGIPAKKLASVIRKIND